MNDQKPSVLIVDVAEVALATPPALSFGGLIVKSNIALPLFSINVPFALY